MTSERMELKRCTFLFPKDLHRWLKRYAVNRETTMTEVILEYLEDLRRKEENNNQSAREGVG